MADGKTINISWKLTPGKNDDAEYIEILSHYKDYGYSTKIRLIAAALKEFQRAHKLSANNSDDLSILE